MRNKISSVYLLFIIVSILISCSGKKNEEKIPSEIIPFDSMVTVMADIHISETRTMMSGFPDSATKAKQASYYKFILEKNKIDSTRFKRSFEYYSLHVSLMNNLYDKVIDELSKRQAEVEK